MGVCPCCSPFHVITLNTNDMDKLFYTMDNIGRAKYTVSKFDGVSTHKDGSPFYDIAIFNNKKKETSI